MMRKTRVGLVFASMLPCFAIGQAQPIDEKPQIQDPKLLATIQAKYTPFVGMTTKKDARGLSAALSKIALPEFVYIRNASEAADRKTAHKFIADSWARMLTCKTSNFKVTKVAKYSDRALAVVVREMNGTAKDLKGKVVPAVLRTYYQDEWQPTPKGYAMFVTRELRSELLVNGKNILPTKGKTRAKVGIRPIPNFKPPKAVIKAGGG